MTIEKHGNKWRIRQMVDGHTYTVSFDHKPSKVEAMRALSDHVTKAPAASDMTFRMACTAYIEAKANILSPSTIKEYLRTASGLPDPFCDKPVLSITYLHE